MYVAGVHPALDLLDEQYERFGSIHVGQAGNSTYQHASDSA